MSARKTIVGTNTSLNGDTVSSTIDVSTNPTNSIVNNLNVTVKGTDEKEIPKVDSTAATTTEIDNPYTHMVKYPSTDINERDLEILKFLMQTFQNIIINDPECVANIIDKSGLVVLNGNNLIRLIAMVCDIEEKNVKIEIESADEVGCCGAVKTIIPLKPIRKIKVMRDSDVFNDFQLTYNDLYNKIIDDYKVSLENVYQPLF